VILGIAINCSECTNFQKNEAVQVFVLISAKGNLVIAIKWIQMLVVEKRGKSSSIKRDKK